MERMQSTYENRVDFNLSESGVHPLRLSELVDDDAAREALLDESLRYTQTNGSEALRSLVAAARFAAEADEPLKPGWLVMAGGASHAEALKPGLYVECEVQNLGRCSFSVAE